MTDRYGGYRDVGTYGYFPRGSLGSGFGRNGDRDAPITEVRSGTVIPKIGEEIWQKVFADFGKDWRDFVDRKFARVDGKDGSLGPLNKEAEKPNFSPYFAFGYLVMRAGLRDRGAEIALIPPRTVVRFDYQQELRQLRIEEYRRRSSLLASSLERDVRVTRLRQLESEQAPSFLAMDDVFWIAYDSRKDFIAGAAEMYALARFKDADDVGVYQQPQEAVQGLSRITSGPDRVTAYNASQESGPSAMAHAFAQALEKQAMEGEL